MITSFFHGNYRPLLHVVASPEIYHSLNIKVTDLDIDHRLSATFDNSIRLIGFDAPTWNVARGQNFQFTRSWLAVNAARGDEQWSILTQLRSDGSTKLELVDRGCHNTCPVENWKAGEVVVETYGMYIPGDMSPGKYAVYVGLRDENNRLAPFEGSDGPTPGLVFVGNLTIE